MSRKSACAVLLVLPVVVGCVHSYAAKAPQPESPSLRILVGLPDAPHRIVTIDSDGAFVDAYLGGTHMLPASTRKGTLRPGELNDIRLTIAESGFWESCGDPEELGVSGIVLEVQQGVRRHRVFEQETQGSNPSKLRTLTKHILSFVGTGG